MKCICGKQMKAIWHDGNEYFYYQCDTCYEEICKDCSIIDEDTGNCECVYCYETSLHRPKKEVAPCNHSQT